MPLSFLEQIEFHAAHQPDALAVVESSAAGIACSITWRQFRDAVGAFAALLQSKFEKGSVIFLIAPGGVRYMVAFHACLAADMTVFPLSIHSTQHERRDAVVRSAAAACISIDEIAGTFCDLNVLHIPLDSVPVDDFDPHVAMTAFARCRNEGAMLLQSSGTTGMPKMVRRSHEALLAVGENCRQFVNITADDRMLAVIPISHSYGIDHAVLACVLAGATIEVGAGFDAAWTRRRLLSHDITILPAVPFIFESLAQSTTTHAKLPRLRHAFSAGSPLPRRVFDAFLHAFATPLGQIYGSTEFGSITFNDPANSPFDPLCVGRPMHGVRVRIVDRDHPDVNAPLPCGVEGQVAIAAESMFSQSLHADESLKRGDWFLPADLGVMDEHGRLTITGRTKLLIDVGGLKVNPLEVEAKLEEHPSVKEAVVVPVTMSDTIQRVKAIIIWRDRAGAGDVAALRSFAQQQLAPHKVPRIFEEREDLPRSPTGKVLRSALITA